MASFIGDKQNAAVGLARGELIAPWDDDDISLPWRLSLSVERLCDGDYFNPRCYWFLDNEGLNCDHSMGYAHNASLFRRAAFEGVGGYPPVSLGADGALDAAFSGLAHAAVDPLRKDKELRRSEWFFPPVSLLAEGLRSRNPPAAGHPRGTAREAARLSTGTQAYRRLRRPTRGGHRTWIPSGRPLSTTPTR